MKSIINKIANDGVLSLGLILIVLSLFFFILPELGIPGADSKMDFTVFVTNYIISIVYFVILWVKRVNYFYSDDIKANLEYGFLHLILCLISAYSLNRNMNVFENSAGWVQMLLVTQCVSMILIFFKDQLPAWMRNSLFFVMGIGFVLFLYLSIYLIPLFILGLVGFFVIGISLHVFIPAAFIVTIAIFIYREDNRKKAYLLSFFSGIAISLLIVVVFALRWASISSLITKTEDNLILEEKSELPAWVSIAQKLPKNSFTQKLMKADLVYSVSPDRLNWEWFDMPSRTFDEPRKHDPLVMISTFFCGNPKLGVDDRIKVLESIYDSRHHAQERLWTGDDLATSHVITNVRVYPSLRIGYTEKIISIRNQHLKNSWNPSEEAIYTFHLPEGGVVTSLSLWINGKEEKAVLTSKSKADSAYRTIVGRESRDPSLVRWQEGNAVSVRVFPCTPSEDRRFKIGITAPLVRSGDQLKYGNIWFDGPSVINAGGSTQIVTMDEVDLKLPGSFKQIKSNTWLADGSYKHDWEFSMQCPALKTNNFSFNGQSYNIEDYEKKFAGFDPKAIYLDLNKSWSESEYEKILSLAGTKEVFVFTDKLIKVTDKNSDQVFREAGNANFSLFPFYEVKMPENSIVITKGTMASPNLSDLTDCEFSSNLGKYFVDRPKMKVFNLGTEISPFIKTLKELRAFEFDFGTVEYLATLINERKYAVSQEDNGAVVINGASIKIMQKEGESASNAPDHVMRLFSYNQVMSQIGVNYIKTGFQDSTIVKNAYRAYVVSPVTSLVVLETQEDYKRFNIKDEGTSLKNASMKSSGAVPEPHEWALIVVVAGLVIVLCFRKKKLAF